MHQRLIGIRVQAELMPGGEAECWIGSRRGMLVPVTCFLVAYAAGGTLPPMVPAVCIDIDAHILRVPLSAFFGFLAHQNARHVADLIRAVPHQLPLGC